MKVKREIEIDLTEKEIIELANEASLLQSDYFKKEFDFAEYKKNQKRKIDDLKAIVIDLLRKIERGKKDVTLECDEKFDFENREIIYIHENKEVDRKNMTLNEFDDLIEKYCEIKIDSLNATKQYYYNDKLIYSRHTISGEENN
jgi:hypothetical protein